MPSPAKPLPFIPVQGSKPGDLRPLLRLQLEQAEKEIANEKATVKQSLAQAAQRAEIEASTCPAALPGKLIGSAK